MAKEKIVGRVIEGPRWIFESYGLVTVEVESFGGITHQFQALVRSEHDHISVGDRVTIGITKKSR